ncbi:MAG: hypothetical protein CVV10_04565 [Gammaproteobacteria bacterium HGW-Gammaproteobacteria-14]|nr:MAG: hypothetical protein CVV10_04565 [Gammaproteobacteria bacterium HGW-Gammaproteobacteria-14]
MPALRAALALIIVITLSHHQALAREDGWEGTLPDRFFDTFMEFYRNDPSALARYPGGLRNISSEQLHRAIIGLDTTHFSYLYPMSIRGHELPTLEGTPIKRLSLMAVRGKRMIPIPFQIDEFDRTGLIWIPGHNKAPAEGKPDILDDFDELVFMFRDGGQLRYDSQQHGEIEGRVLHEIRLDSPRNNPRYVYLMLDNPERSEANYVQVDFAKGRIDTTVMEMVYDTKNVINIEHIASKVGPHHGINLFDSMYINISTGILNQNMRINLESGKNIRAVPVAVKDGPIRASFLVRTRIWYMYLPTLFNQQFGIHFYEQGIVVPSRFAIDGMRTLRYFLMFLREPRIEFSVDFHNLEGAKVTFDSVHKTDEDWGIVDGVMSPFEERMASYRLPGDWLHMASGRGWEMFFANHMPVVENGLFDAFLDGMTLSMIYRDDKADVLPHERFPGATPRFGFSSSGMPGYVIDLLSSLPRMNFSRIDTLGEAIILLAEEENRGRGKLDGYDRAANKVLSRLRDEGRITSATQLADAFIADINRMKFTGMERDQLHGLLRDAIIAVVDDPGAVQHGQVLAKMVELANARNIDIAQLRYGSMDNTLWLPDWTGEGGPRDFHWQVQNPPRHTIRPAPPQPTLY